jgi:hypothetical protein
MTSFEAITDDSLETIHGGQYIWCDGGQSKAVTNTQARWATGVALIGGGLGALTRNPVVSAAGALVGLVAGDSLGREIGQQNRGCRLR